MVGLKGLTISSLRCSLLTPKFGCFLFPGASLGSEVGSELAKHLLADRDTQREIAPDGCCFPFSKLARVDLGMKFNSGGSLNTTTACTA
jgi:hypothetical protein